MAIPIELTDATFGETLNTDQVVVVDFWATWCGPCKMMAPMIERLSGEFEGKAVIGKLDVDDNPEASAQFGIRSIPTLLYFRNGEVVDRVVGLVDYNVIRQKLERWS